jgi:hypothetical protein
MVDPLPAARRNHAACQLPGSRPAKAGFLGFVPIPNGDAVTSKFAFGGPDNQYIYFEGRSAARSGDSRRRILA